MDKSFISKCRDLLNDKNKEIKKNTRFYNLKEICMREYFDKKMIVPIGKNDNKEYIYMDLTNVNGLFIAGTTGTGKSIFIDDLIVTLMLKNSPKEVKFVLLESFGYELGEYDGIKYIYDNEKKSKMSIKHIETRLIKIWTLINERISSLSKEKCKSIESYNKNHEEKW